jgi:hypothetical protein
MTKANKRKRRRNSRKRKRTQQVSFVAEVGLTKDVMGPWDDRYSGSAKEIEAHTIERCAQELNRLNQNKFSDNDQFAIGFSEAIKQAQIIIYSLKDKPDRLDEMENHLSKTIDLIPKVKWS